MSYPFGQAVRLSTGTITGPSGPQNPSTLTLTITLPDTTTTVYHLTDFTADSTGVYHLDYLPTESGAFDWRIVATGPNAAAEGTFEVDAVGAHFADVVPLDYIKAHLNMTSSTADDNELEMVVAAAVDLAEDIIGPINPVSVTETHLMDGTNTIALNTYPVTSIQSVVTSSGISFGSTPNPGSFYYLLLGGTLNLFTAYGFGWTPEFSQVNFDTGFVTVTITYTAGRATLSPKRQLGIAELVRHLWNTQQGSVGRQTQDAQWAPSGATTKLVMELFGNDVMPGIG